MSALKFFAKVDANLDSNPKIRRAGRNGREVYLFVLRRHRLLDRNDGHVNAADVEPWYLADQLMMTEAEAADGLARAIGAKLLAPVGEVVEIVGWESEWGMGPMTEAERKRLQRARGKDVRTSEDAQPIDVTPHNACPDVVRTTSGRNVTSPDCHGSDQIRGDQIRTEELSPARSGDAGIPAAAEPQPATPAPTPSPVIRDRHQQVLTGAWAYHRERFLALRADGIGKNAIAPSGIAMGSAEVAISERIGELRAKGLSYDDIAAKLRHRVDVGEAECRREAAAGSTNPCAWFGSTNAWSHGPFWRALETSVEQAREPKPATAARASPRIAAIGPCRPSPNHPTSTQLEDLA